ncbi:hypothetical protein HGM15179_003663 [Zosterops borbonicus]|uniref:Uncharacterized protein n=1 Tax=Zosterops borbonicus TaxID=364589 RepID=A0A8K1LRX9_9PASS|nr:hypothetical protein HGM15179_003663 [Zosterops borbonicus]
MGRDWRSHRVAVTGLVAAGGGEMLWEMDCSGLQGLGDVWKMAMEDFFPHLVDLRILILIYGRRFHGFRDAKEEALTLTWVHLFDAVLLLLLWHLPWSKDEHSNFTSSDPC